MNRWLTYLGLVGYVFIGTAAVLMPAIMPSMTEEFAAMGLTVATIAFIFPARAVGGILGNLLAGVGSDLMGRQRLVWLSAFILASALALTGVTKSWMLFVVGFALVSVAQAALSTGINAMIADANPGAQARALNMLHGIYGVGAAVSPLIIGYLIERGMAWRWALGGTGFIWLLYGIGAYLLYRTRTSTEQRDQVQQLDLTMLRKGAFFALFLIAFAYNGVAWSLLG
ncbi:MFS transporter [Chloroflexi bacterium TSY]|nr:MFS transporter [Chloroflexi bacterium TSY]